MKTWVVGIAITVAGCGDSAAIVDAPLPSDASADVAIDAVDRYACLGVALPTTAPDPLTVSGTSYQITPVGIAVEPSITIQGYSVGDPIPKGSVVSDSQGAFSITAATGGIARFGYLKLSGTGFVDTYAYGPTASYRDESGAIAPILMMSTLDQLASAASVTQASANGLLVITAVDCAGVAIAGAVFATNPPGSIIYNTSAGPNPAATMSNASGIGYAFNVPPGDITVTATVGAMVLRSHVVGAVAGAPTFANIQP